MGCATSVSSVELVPDPKEGNSVTAVVGPLGILCLDQSYPAHQPGALDAPDTFTVELIRQVVPGLTYDKLVEGQLDPRVEEAVIESIRRLEKAGAEAIIADCSLMLHLQSMCATVTSTPLCFSSLVQLPTVLSQLDPGDEIALLVITRHDIEVAREPVARLVGVDLSEPCFVPIELINDVPGMDSVMWGEKVDVSKVITPLLQCVSAALQRRPKITSLIIEHADLAPYAAALRERLQMPVYDAVTCASLFLLPAAARPSADARAIGALGASAAPSPLRGNTWDTLGGSCFDELLSGGAVALLDAAWIVQLWRSGGRIRRRQDLDGAAFISLDALRAAGCPYGGLPIIVVS